MLQTEVFTVYILYIVSFDACGALVCGLVDRCMRNALSTLGLATWALQVASCLALGVLSDVVHVDPRGSTFTQARRSHRCHTHSQSRTPTVYSIHFQYRVYVMLASAIAVQYVASWAHCATCV